VAADGSFLLDVICLGEETVHPGATVYDPTNPLRHTAIPADARFDELRTVVMDGGQRCGRQPTLDEMADRSKAQLASLPQGCLRFINPHRYKVSCSKGLNDLRLRLMEEIEHGYLTV